MAFGIYKQGQGYWTRMMTLLGLLTVFGWGAAWLSNQLGLIQPPRDESGQYKIEPALIQGIGAFTVLIIGAAIAYWVAYANPKTSEFFIATEGEMKKVNWSTRKEIVGSTWVVIGISVLLAACLFVVDLAFSTFFKEIGVLQTG